jgi:DNA-binding MarR family transcriptional regulator
MKTATDLSSADYRALSDFRYQIRRFLHFSEAAAKAEGLEPQQHQMLLAIRTLGESESSTIGKLAECLLVRHHSAVGMVDRLVERGLVDRVRDTVDRRQVQVRLTTEGEDRLKRLSKAHREELRYFGPLLVTALGSLLQLVPE